MGMKLIIFPLLIMFTAAILGQVVSTSQLGNSVDGSVSGGSFSGGISINGNQSTVSGGEQLNFGIDPSTGAIAIIITALALGSVVGIQVVGSGLNAVSSMAIFKLTTLYVIWGLVGVLGIGTISAIPYFGWIIFFALTLAYTLGAIGQVSFSGGTE
jgi:hypothetical protein